MPLDPQVWAILETLQGRPALADGTVESARSAQAETRSLLGRGPDVESVDDLAAPTRNGEIWVRRYRPKGVQSGILVYVHGGGWMIGEADDFDLPARQLANETGYTVFLPEYRLAPEHRYPAALEDIEDVLRWADARRNPSTQSPEPLVVAGDSAGANLAVSAIRVLRGSIRVDRLAAIYPVVDCDFDRRSYHEFAEGYLLTRKDMIWFFKNYCSEHEYSRPEISLLRSNDFDDMPETLVVTAEYDVLRDEGLEFYRLLHSVNGNARHLLANGLTHGFVRWINIVEEARRHVSLVGEFLSERQ